MLSSHQLWSWRLLFEPQQRWVWTLQKSLSGFCLIVLQLCKRFSQHFRCSPLKMGLVGVAACEGCCGYWWAHFTLRLLHSQVDGSVINCFPKHCVLPVIHVSLCVCQRYLNYYFAIKNTTCLKGLMHRRWRWDRRNPEQGNPCNM